MEASKKEEFETIVREKLERLLGFNFDMPVDRLETEKNSRVDLIFHREGKDYLVHVKSISPRANAEEAKGSLAMMILDMKDKRTDSTILGLMVRRLSPNLISELRGYARAYTDAGLLLMDQRGSLDLDVPFLDTYVQELNKKPAASPQKVHNERAFTDLNRWLLKVLMLWDAPVGMWPGAISEKVGNPAELARCAGVSSAKAYQFAQTFKKLRWLRWNREEFEIIDRVTLFQQWYQSERQILFERIPVRPLLPRSVDEVYKGMEGVSYAVGGLAACGFHGVRHVVGGVPEVHIFDSVDKVVESAQLEVCEEHEAVLFLRRGPNRESIERGIVEMNGIRVVDVLQAALDVSQLPVRGEEQADHIIHGVLGWEK